MKQDCIFLPTLFPMRSARSAAGMSPEGEPLTPFRSPSGIREGSDPDFSFDGWSESDPLPEYEDQAHGYRLTRPLDVELLGDEGDFRSPGNQTHYPSHPAFGETSVVAVRAPPRMGAPGSSNKTTDEALDMRSNSEVNSSVPDLRGGSETGEDISHSRSEEAFPLYYRNQRRGCRPRLGRTIRS